MPDGLNDILANAKNEIASIADYIKNEVVEGALEVRDFAVEAVAYEAANIKPQFLKLVADCMAAAEQDMPEAAGVDKYQFAFSNAVSVAERDGVQFVESLFDACVQYVIAERNKRRASQVAPEAAPEETPPAAA